jgi:hypothetical protein
VQSASLKQEAPGLDPGVRSLTGGDALQRKQAECEGRTEIEEFRDDVKRCLSNHLTLRYFTRDGVS